MINLSGDEFTLEDRGTLFQFRLLPMRPKEAREVYPHVARVLGPVLSVVSNMVDADEAEKSPDATEGDGAPKRVRSMNEESILAVVARSVPVLAEALDQFPSLEDAFLKKCQFKPEGASSFVPMATIVDTVFIRRHKLKMLWLARCVVLEFGDFLGEDGQSLVQALASLSTSQTT